MRLLKLEIQNVRGIRHLTLEPQGKNFAIWGPNGSGKSAVVDAIDFLLTGRVTRLTGEGTGGITLSRHGPHIDQDPENATVCALLELPGLRDPVELKRCMARPGTLECDRSLMPSLKPILILARRGQHVLTRREILGYITADPSTRADQIQTLLNVSEIEGIRRSLVRVNNDYARSIEAATQAVRRTRAEVSATVGERVFQMEKVLEIVNEKRAILEGESIAHLQASQLKIDLRPPVVVARSTVVDVTLFERHATNLRDMLSKEGQEDIAQTDAELRALLATIRSDPQMERALARRRLLELGLALMDESESCPLCETAWPPGELRARLGRRLETARLAERHHDRVSQLSSRILDRVNAAIASARSVTIAAKTIAPEEECATVLETWHKKLGELADALASPLDKYPHAQVETADVQRMVAPKDLTNVLNDLGARARMQYPVIGPEQLAWDTLTQLGVSLRRLESEEDARRCAELAGQRASTLLNTFQAARDKVLGELYDAVRDRFVSLYRRLHGSDEEEFVAKLEPGGAGIDLEVDFYGHGTHPPQALHSEGHQDSMGLCLFLALAEQLTCGVMDLIILDDVMMSIDAEHRRALCYLLHEVFPHRQFLITTHDKTWANQLRCEGLVTSRRSLEFYNWSLASGPQVNHEVDMWERIERDMAADNVPDAAPKLRRGSEAFFASACDSLRADVAFRLDHRWELGDFAPAAIGQYRKLLKQAKKAAQSWGDTEKFETLNELDSIASQVFARSYAEQWAVNVNVHYNEWANFRPEDFRPVVEAFHDLFSLFLCSRCGGMIRVLTAGHQQEAVRCGCGLLDWGLVEKAKG